uniref:Uncharacterized protein n=1 Tax=Manihot esculenta TaxID=3983 RepID=A0A2C9VBM8_MANES
MEFGSWGRGNNTQTQEEEEVEEEEMGRFQEATSVLVSVILRKSISMFYEVAFPFVDLLWILTSAVEYSRFNRNSRHQSPPAFTVTYSRSYPITPTHDR